MFDTVLFPTDGSEGATAVVESVLDLAATHDATLHVLNVADTTHDSVTRLGGEVVDVLEREGEQIVDDVEERAGTRDVDAVSEVVQGGVPESIVSYAAVHDVDLIVMPTRGRSGLHRILLGSVTERVVRRSDVPVLTLPTDGAVATHVPARRLLVPTDGSEHAETAVDLGIDLANAHTAALHVLSVVDTAGPGIDSHSEQHVAELESQAERAIDAATTAAHDEAVESVTGAIEHGTGVHREIRSYIDRHEIDLVVTGTHGRTGLDRYLMGSVTEKIVRSAPIPVLAVPGRDSTA